MPEFEIAHERSHSFYSCFERKAELQHQTHYCPGCGHGVIHKLVARAIDQLGIQDRTVFVSPVGCSVFAYCYFNTGNVQVAHGRAPAAATALKRALPHGIVLSYQGDGDLAAIGAAEILHAANRGEPITVFFVNNAIYGMTGGQIAPTTPLGEKTITSPSGRSASNEGYPLPMSEVLATLEAPVYIERVALGNSQMIIAASKAIRRAIENQVKGLGFSFIEILSPCPTIWGMPPVEAQSWVRERLTEVFPLGVLRDRTASAEFHPAQLPAPPVEEVHRLVCGLAASLPAAVKGRVNGHVDLRVRIAGFGGQGVLTLGQVLAEAGINAGLEVSWLPSYGPEMRSGTSNCHVRLSSEPIDSPLVTRPNVLLALNEPSLRKFMPAVEPGGLAIYNGTALPDGMAASDTRVIVQPFTALADHIGEPRAANLIMLGALLETTPLLDPAAVDAALERVVKSERWLEIDRKAVACGREIVRSEGVCLS